MSKEFNPSKRQHWPIIAAYQNGRLSHRQAAAQLRDLGCVDWEIALYLDDDQDGPEADK